MTVEQQLTMDRPADAAVSSVPDGPGIKTILLHILDDEFNDQRIETALGLARAACAHVSCLHVTPTEAYVAFDTFGGVFVMKDVMRAIDESTAALQIRVEERIKQEDVSWAYEELAGDTASILLRRAALADILVTSREPVRRDFVGPTIGFLGDLLHGARTPLLIPGSDRAPFDPNGPALVAWKGSIEAADAVRASLGLLKLASNVRVIEVPEGKTGPKDFPATKLLEYLSRHGIHAELRVEPSPTGEAGHEVIAGMIMAEATPDAIADAPAAYSDVPKLGPPLPGDLGRAILDRQRQLGAEGQGASSGTARDPEAERAGAERKRLASEEQAARASSVLVQLSRATPGNSATPPTEPPPPSASPSMSEPAVAGTASLGPQQHKLDFVRSIDGDTNSHSLTGPFSPSTLSAGTIIPASLITGLNSDVPGMVIAQVTENVRDSATGRTVLIPQGARLIGEYDSVVAFGQKRALLVWSRIVFPDGSSVRLDSMPATDAAGYAGLEDKVDFHEWRLLKGILLSSILGAGTEFSAGGNDGDIVRALRDTTWQNGSRAGDQIVSRNLDVQPTLTVRPGWPVRAIVHKDLVLSPWRG